MAKAVYSNQPTIEMYYGMQFGPFLTTGNRPCLTEPYYQAMLELLAPHIEAKTTALDMGCGLGRMVFELANVGIERAFGIDSSGEFITVCKKIAKQQDETVAYPVPTGANLSFFLADAQALPFSANAFHCVLCLNLIDRVASPRAVIAELTRVLSPTGLLLISDPYDWEDERTAPADRIDDMRVLFPQSQWEILHEEDRVPFTLRVYDRKISTYANQTLLLRKR